MRSSLHGTSPHELRGWSYISYIEAQRDLYGACGYGMILRTLYTRHGTRCLVGNPRVIVYIVLPIEVSMWLYIAIIVKQS